MKQSKMIPFAKLSKKKQREENSRRRNGWGGLNPVTRRPQDPHVYNRRKAQKAAENEIDRD